MMLERDIIASTYSIMYLNERETEAYMNEVKRKRTVVLSLAAFLSIYAYIFFHELGHVIVMLSAGDTITEFNMIKAYVSGYGGNYTDISDLWLHANGVVFPVILSIIYMIFYDRNKKNVFYVFFSFFVGVIPSASAFFWVISPIMFNMGVAPAGDDSTKFLLNFSQTYNPLIVSVVASLVVLTGVVLLVKKGLLHNYICGIKEK